MEPVLVGTSHGTDDPAGQAAVRALLDGVRAARPGLDVREAFVDVQQPELGKVLAGAVADAGSAVVVPLLLSTGYHVQVDIAEAVAAVNASGSLAVAAEPMGPDPRLVDLLAERLAAVGPRPEDELVLAAAGSSVAAAAVAVEEVTRGLAERLGRPVAASYGAGARPRVPDAVAAARASLAERAGPAGSGAGGAGRVVVASYLLAPGYFQDRVLEAGADVVSEPLALPGAADPRLVALVLDRYDEAAARLPR
ncbi:sirohydrochlorin chelatase [Antribacter sp. KLBMP9083]|uniref:Sirohydrochlorin chelatase n=1 Tax=Antribacter soli TaxID=2910976 RepID=A0AA41QCH4_9MICO|nr:CbiX/SirB N-terminal domain-containing protein [Antribacter soli]MCF4120596.1 sirohydrochlorin chelatase [Antribacter soli]